MHGLRASVFGLRMPTGDRLREMSRGAVLVLCATIYTDVFPVNAPQAQLYTEIKVELCEYAHRADVVVSSRLYRDVSTARGLEQVEVRPWEELARQGRPDPITQCPKEAPCASSVSPSSPFLP